MAQLLSPAFTEKFKKQFKKLPQTLQQRFIRKLAIFLINPNHPSFYSRKMGGANHFEGRLTKHYRFTYLVVGDEVQFLTIGPHDEGLGKK